MEQNQDKPNYERGIAGNRRLKTQAKHNSSVSNSRIEQKLFVEEKGQVQEQKGQVKRSLSPLTGCSEQRMSKLVKEQRMSNRKLIQIENSFQTGVALSKPVGRQPDYQFDSLNTRNSLLQKRGSEQASYQNDHRALYQQQEARRNSFQNSSYQCDQKSPSIQDRRLAVLTKQTYHYD